MNLFRIASLALVLFSLAACGRPHLTDEIKQQEDLDHLRLSHLEHWTAVIEDYHEKKGTYPLQNLALTSGKIGHVQILPSKLGDQQIDWGDSFDDFSTVELVKELKAGLNRDIVFGYPPEPTVPTYALAYNYFVEKDGYVLWVSCQSCGITEISTYTMDGTSATVNIASENMVPKVTKALTRKDMLAHPRYKKWRSNKLHDEKNARKLEKAAAQ